MKKLLELKKLEKEVQEALNTIERPEGIYVCYHSQYEIPSFSIFTKSGQPYRVLNTGVCDYRIDNEVDDQVADEIISQIEEVLK